MILNNNEKMTSKAYTILTSRRGKIDNPISRKWAKNYGIKVELNLIKRSLEKVMKMNLQPKIKEHLIRHINQSFVPINSLKKLRILKEETCKECGENITDYEHILFSCPTSRYI